MYKNIITILDPTAEFPKDSPEHKFPLPIPYLLDVSDSTKYSSFPKYTVPKFSNRGFGTFLVCISASFLLGHCDRWLATGNQVVINPRKDNNQTEICPIIMKTRISGTALHSHILHAL